MVPNGLVNKLLKEPAKMLEISQSGCQIQDHELESYPFELKITNFMNYTSLS